MRHSVETSFYPPLHATRFRFNSATICDINRCHTLPPTHLPFEPNPSVHYSSLRHPLPVCPLKVNGIACSRLVSLYMNVLSLIQQIHPLIIRSRIYESTALPLGGHAMLTDERTSGRNSYYISRHGTIQMFPFSALPGRFLFPQRGFCVNTSPLPVL